MVEQLPKEYIVIINSVEAGDIVMNLKYNIKDYCTKYLIEKPGEVSYIHVTEKFTERHLFSKDNINRISNLSMYDFKDWVKTINFDKKENLIKSIL